METPTITFETPVKISVTNEPANGATVVMSEMKIQARLRDGESNDQGSKTESLRAETELEGDMERDSICTQY